MKHSAITESLAKLEKVCRNRPELALLSQITSQVLREVFQPDIQIPDGCNDLFSLLNAPFTEHLLRRNWLAASRIIASAGDEPLGKWAESIVQNDNHSLTRMLAERITLPPELSVGHSAPSPMSSSAATILRLSALPILATFSLQRSVLVNPESGSDDVCPLCGNLPLLGELRGLERQRWLRCGWCASQWQVDRMYCSFCGTRDHRLLRTLLAGESEENQFVLLCNRCDCWIPHLSTLSPLTAADLLVAEVQLVHLRLCQQSPSLDEQTGTAQPLDSQGFFGVL